MKLSWPSRWLRGRWLADPMKETTEERAQAVYKHARMIFEATKQFLAENGEVYPYAFPLKVPDEPIAFDARKKDEKPPKENTIGTSIVHLPGDKDMRDI